MFLTMLLNHMGEMIDIDEVGLDEEDFEFIDIELDKILPDYDIEKVKQEVIELVHMIKEAHNKETFVKYRLKGE